MKRCERWDRARFGGPDLRELWVYEWVAYRRVMCNWTWRQIATELGCGVTLAREICEEWFDYKPMRNLTTSQESSGNRRSPAVLCS